MRHVKSLWSVVCATMLVAGSVASAQNFNRTTHLTFSTPVELPGITLPAGTYTFRLSDSMSDRHIVQVLDKDGAKLHTTILAIPAKRLHVTDETVVTFHEVPAEATPAVRYWYYPGDEIGQEFAYPKAQAMRIAAASGNPVLSSGSDASMSAQVTRVEPAAAGRPAPPETPAQLEASGRQRLPQTASNLPLLGLMGLLVLGGAIATRAIRARA